MYYGEEVEIPYPEGADGTGSKRPEGRSFHHGRFIQKLRATAMRTPNVTVVESTATDVVKNGWTGQILGVECTTKGEKDYVSVRHDLDMSLHILTIACAQYFGHLTVIADGYASKFRKEYIRHQPTSRSKFWGLELIDADLPRPYHGHVILGDGAPILLYQIGTHETRALIDIPENTPTASVKAGGVKSHLRNVVLPTLPKRVQPSFEAAIDRGGLRSMPNSFLPASKSTNPGLIMLGDAMNMRHPLTGGGMTVAFNDVVLLSELLSPEVVPRLDDTKLVLKQMSTFHWRRKNLTSVINILAQALYSLFAADGMQLQTHVQGGKLTRGRHQSKGVTTWLLPLLPDGRPMHRWTCWSSRRHYPSAFCPFLSLLRCRLVRHLDPPVTSEPVLATLRIRQQLGCLLEGLCRHIPLHILRIEGLSLSKRPRISRGVHLGLPFQLADPLHPSTRLQTAEGRCYQGYSTKSTAV